MKKIRIGKEFSVRWGLILNGLPAELDKLDVKVVLTLPFGNKKELRYTADRNILVIPVGRNVQPMTGAYTLSLWINKDKDGQTVVDCSPAFCLVASTDEESCAQVQAIKEVLDLGTSEIQLGVQGKSAYQTWLDEGNEGTEQDFLNWLRQPSTEAGTDAQAAAAKATEAAAKANKAAESATSAAADAVRIATASAEQSEQRVTAAIGGLNQSVSQAEQKVSEAVSKAAEATGAAESAAESATASSAKAEASSSKADASKAEADKAATSARTATQEAHTAKQGADSAAAKATEAAGRADAAAGSVNTAISNAAAATDKANASSAKADSSAAKADAATTRATTAAQKAEEMTAAGNKVLPTLEGYKDHLDKITTEYNVSVFHPSKGSGNSNRYTLATAIVQVPEELRVPGLVVSFLNQQSKVEKWEYQGGAWAVASFKKPSGGGGNMILPYKTDVATTRKQVQESERVPGMQISYKGASGWVNEQYIGLSFANTYWSADGNWNRILTELDYERRGYSVYKEYIGLKAENGLLIGSASSEYNVNHVDISGSDYVDAVVRCYEPSYPGLTFWDSNKSRLLSYNANQGLYIDGKNFRFFLKRPDKAVYVSVGAYYASDDVNFLKLIKVPTGKDIIDLDARVSRNRNDIDKTFQELIPLKSATDLLTMVVADYTGLVDGDGRTIDSTPAFAPEEIAILIPIRDCNIIQWCTKVFSPESIAVILYSKNRKQIKQIKGRNGTRIEGSIYAGTIDLSSEEFKDNEVFYVAIGSYNASSDLNRLYLKLLKKLPKDAISGIKDPLINLMSAVRVVNKTDYFPNHWGNSAHKWWYNIGNTLFIGNTKKESTKKIYAVARFSREDIDNLGMTGCSDLFLSIEGDKSRSSISFSVSDGITTVEHGYGKPYTNVSPYYGERAVRVDVSRLNLSDCDELILTVSVAFPSLGLSQLDIKLFKEMPYGDRPIVDSSYKSQYYGLPEYTFYGQEKLADAINKVTDGGTLYIREGDYIIDRPISLKKSINIIGVGRVRLLGGKKISEAESQGTDDVYTKTVNTSDIGYAGASYIYQHDIPDSNTLIKDTERLHLYGDNQLYRLPSTRIWKSNSIDKVLSPQPGGKLYYYVDPESNLMTFRIAPGSSLSKNPVILNRIPYNTMGTLNKNDYNIACSWDDISIQNITNMYSAITVNGFNNLRMDNVKIFCVSTCPLRITTAQGLNNHFSNIEVAGGFEDGIDFGQPLPENFGIFIKCEKSKYLFENCWLHDNYGDGISEHGNDSVIIRDSVLEWNGLSGATPAGGESLYVNCIFRRNGWQSAERAGLYVLPADTDSHVVAIGCTSVDNWNADYGILSDGHAGSVVSLQLYNCSSLQTDDTTSDAVSLAANIKTEDKRHGYLGLFNFVTNRITKFKGDKQNLTITQAPSVVE